MKLLLTWNGVSHYYVSAEFSADNRPKIFSYWQSLLEYFDDKRPRISREGKYEYLFADLFQHYLSECNMNKWLECDINLFRKHLEILDFEIEYSKNRGAEVVYVDMRDESDEYYLDE